MTTKNSFPRYCWVASLFLLAHSIVQASSFTTSLRQCSKSSLGLEIPNNDSNGIRHTINVTDHGRLKDVNVVFSELLHDHVGELSASIIHGGVAVKLMDKPGFPGSEFGCTGISLLNLKIDDQGSKSVENACNSTIPAYDTIPYTPNESLSAFNEMELSGEWTLVIQDNASFNDTPGKLNKWCLEYTDESVADLSIPDLPSQLDLGTSNVGSPVHVVFNISETSNIDPLIVTANLTGTHASDFKLYADSFFPATTLQSFPYTATIAPGLTHSYRAECRPGGAGLREADLILYTNSASQSQLIYHLTCTGITAGYDSLPLPGSTLDFGSTDANTSTTEQVIEITETSGMATLSINATITGTHKEDFSISSYSPSVGPSGQGYLNVKCFPGEAGIHTATLEIDTNDPLHHPARYILICEGLSAKFQAAPAPSRLDFGTTQPGVPVNKLITITNTGNKPLTLDKLDNEASAIIGASVFNLDISLPYLLSEGSSVTVSVSCIPTTTETSAADLTLHTDDPTNPIVRYPLACIGSSVIEPLYTSLAPYPPGSTISFGYVPTTAQKNLLMREIGSAPLTIAQALIEGPDASDFNITGVSFPLTIPNGGDDVPLTIECTPNPLYAGKIREAKLTLMTDATNYPQPSYLLNCQGPKSGYTSTPLVNGTVTFPNVMVSETGSKTITIKETGDSPLVVHLAETPLTGSNPLDFKIATAFPLIINNGEAPQTLTVECRPSTTGNLSATLNLVSNDLDNPTPTYNLKCTGKGIVGPGYGSTPLPNSLIDFGKTPIEKPIKAIFTIQEVGSVILNVGKDVLGNIIPPTIEGEHAADFSILTPTFPFNIPNGKPPRTIFLQCTPSAYGLRTATLTITSNHLSQTSTHAYSLQCEGLPPGYASIPPPQTVLDLGKVVINQVTKMSFKIQETGNSTLHVMNPMIDGPHAQEFSLTSPEFPLEMPDGAPEETVSIQCIPLGEGKRTATLTLESDDPANLQLSYPLECTGVPPAGYSSHPPLGSIISVGNVLLGSLTKTTFDIQETGGVPLHVKLDEPAITGEFASEFAVSYFPMEIEDGGATRQVTITCTPSSVGIRAVTLHLITNDPLNPNPSYLLECGGIPLAGYYSTPLPGSTLNFGKVPVGDVATVSFNVQEMGNTLLQVDLAEPPFTGEAASDFSIVSPKFPFSILDGGADQPVTVKCRPSAKGKRVATLNLTSNSPLNPTHRYPLECYGTATTSKEDGEENIILTVSLQGQGRVTSVPPGIDCSPEDEVCYSNHVSNDKVVLTAKAYEGFTFDQWSGDCDAQGHVVLKTSQRCIAVFKPLNPHPLTVTIVGKGQVTSTPKGIECENNGDQCSYEYADKTTVSLQAIRTENWEFKAWEGDCNPQGEVNMESEKHCQATFVEIPSAEQVTLSVEKTGEGQGTVTNQSHQEINCGTVCRHAYRLQSVQTLTAVPQTGSVFVEWSEDCQGTKNSVEVTLTQSKTCVARFEKNQTPPYAHHILTLNVTGMGNGTVTKEVACTAQCHQPVYPEGTSITLTAQAEKNSKFTGWSGHCTGMENPLKLVMNNDKNCLANFDKLPDIPSYTLTVLMEGEGSALVTSSPEGINLTPSCNCSKMSASYPAGTIVMLAASPQRGTKLIGFGGDQACHEGQQILMNKNITCVAAFAEDLPPPVLLPEESNVPSCPLEGTINVICNYENKWSLKDVTVGEQGNISNATLEGTLYNKGWISNVKLQAQSTLTGGVLTGYIENGGVIKDVLFRGATLTGGILAGTILSDDNLGIIQNVQFAPNTYVSGGKLYGTIEGDQEQPALLENVTIIEGSRLDHVIIGKGVKLEGKVNLGSGVIFMDKQNLPPSKLINKEEDAQDQTLKDINVSEEGKLSHGILDGKILNQGTLADVTFGKDSQVIGGILTGQIISQGTLTHIEFQGSQLTGGTLVGAIRNTGGGVIQDVELSSETHLIGGQLAGEIIGHGARLEGVIIQGHVRDVILGQDIRNQGIIQDAEFKGELLSGGDLSGHITNTQGGTLRDVHFKGETHLEGGNLQGDIIGDADHPALLENVRVVAGSYLDNVIIGEGVVLPKKVTLGSGVQFVHPLVEVPKEEKVQSTPSAIGINARGQVVSHQTTFTYELTTSEGVQKDGALLSTLSAQRVTLFATITLDPEHVGQQAEIVVASVYKESPNTSPETYMHVGDKWIAWDYDIKQLEPYRVFQKLPEKLDVPIFTEEDLSSTPGEYTLLIGYRLKDNTIVYNGKTPIHFFVNGAPKRCVLYAVHDEKLNDTQLIKIDLSRSLWGTMQAFGPLHSGRDIEGLTLDPSNPDVLYATSGDDAKVEGQQLDGYLYSINRKTAELTLIGPTGFDQVAALGTDPVGNILWAWGEIKQGQKRQWSGLIQIDPLTGKGTPIKQFDPKDSMGGLAVSPDGSKIYTSSGGTLWVYDKETQEMQKACDHITKGRIEGLDMQPNGILLLGIDLDQTTTITAYDPEACEVIKTRTYEGVKYNDIESIVWPAMECNDQSWLGRESD